MDTWCSAAWRGSVWNTGPTSGGSTCQWHNVTMIYVRGSQSSYNGRMWKMFVFHCPSGRWDQPKDRHLINLWSLPVFKKSYVSKRKICCEMRFMAMLGSFSDIPTVARLLRRLLRETWGTNPKSPSCRPPPPTPPTSRRPLRSPPAKPSDTGERNGGT
jgi:hypothetical protein